MEVRIGRIGIGGVLRDYPGTLWRVVLLIVAGSAGVIARLARTVTDGSRASSRSMLGLVARLALCRTRVASSLFMHRLSATKRASGHGRFA